MLAASGLLAGFAVARASGSRPLGGIVLAVFGLACMSIWWRRERARTALALGALALAAFALAHALGLLIGAWPAVLVAAAAVAAASWQLSDRRAPAPAARSEVPDL